jgi:hypothetical protein
LFVGSVVEVMGLYTWAEWDWKADRRQPLKYGSNVRPLRDRRIGCARVRDGHPSNDSRIARRGWIIEMDVVIFVGFAVVVLLVLLIGGRAERFNLRGLTRPWQPRYRDDAKTRRPRDG